MKLRYQLLCNNLFVYCENVSAKIPSDWFNKIGDWTVARQEI